MFFCTKSILLLTALFILLGHVNGKSYFGIGDPTLSDQLILRDEVKNPHTGLLEEPVIYFKYAIKEPITYIEIVSEENVLANISFSYYNDIINGTVEALSSTMTPDGLNKPFTIFISIYGFNGTTSDMFIAGTLRPQQYTGLLESHPESGEIDHMEQTNNEENDLLEENDNLSEEEERGEEEEEEAIFDEDDTFETMDQIITVGQRQRDDYLLYETYQTSAQPTEYRTNHSVVFYFIDNAYITFIEFVIIDYKNNKTAEEIPISSQIDYSHFSPNTLKAVIRDHKTKALFAKMSVYGYRKEDLPESYVSYIPEKILRENEGSTFTTESPEMHLRSQINALQRNDDRYENLPAELYKSQQDGEFSYVVTSISEASTSGGNALHLTASELAALLVYSAVVVLVCGLW